MPLTLLLGGARSGKSRLASELAGRSECGEIVVVATAEARDDEMAERIRRHQEARPPEWKTIEEPIEVGDALAGVPTDTCVLLDCLTLWVSNLLERDLTDEEIEKNAADAARIASSRAGPTIAVTNEVGSGIVPANALARRYADALGRVNSIWAAEAERSFLVVAGRLLPLVGVEALLDPERTP